MNQRKWESHILKGVNVSNHGAERTFEGSSVLLLFSLSYTCFRGAELHVYGKLYTCIYLPAASSLARVTRAVVTPAFDPVTHGQVGPQPVATIIVSRPLIFPACLSYYRPSRGKTWRGFGHEDVRMFVHLLGRGHPGGLFARRSIESAGGGRRRGEVMEEEALITGLSSLRRSPPAPLA